MRRFALTSCFLVVACGSTGTAADPSTRASTVASSREEPDSHAGDAPEGSPPPSTVESSGDSAAPVRYFIDGEEVDEATFEARFSRLAVDADPIETETIENPDGSYGGSGETYRARDGDVEYDFITVSFVEGDERSESRSINRVQ